MSTLSCDQVRDLAEGFVLGALDPVQTHDVRDHLASCPDPHPEMAELGSVVPYLAESIDPVEPPAELKGRITAAIEAELRAGRRADAAADRLISSLGAGSARPAPRSIEPAAGAAPTAPPTAAVAAGPIATPSTTSPAPIDLAAERSRRRPPLEWIAAIAAAVVIAALGAWNLNISGQLSTAQQEQAAVDHVLAIAKEPGGQAAILVPGAGGGAAGLAAVAPDGSFAMALQGLTATSGTQVYEAWVVAPSGAPVPIGSFAVGENGLGGLMASRAPIGSQLTVGITREPQAGATTPTLPMLVSGVTASGS